jgi:beta-xylosidase
VKDTFYIFGSHLAAAKSKDLMNWDTIATGVANGFYFGLKCYPDLELEGWFAPDFESQLYLN